jgi:hypothetical protein
VCCFAVGAWRVIPLLFTQNSTYCSYIQLFEFLLHVTTGYNGFPRGCSDDALPWARQSDGGFLDTKYAYVCHAEMNAILNRNIAPLHGGLMTSLGLSDVRACTGDRRDGVGGEDRGGREGGSGHGDSPAVPMKELVPLLRNVLVGWVFNAWVELSFLPR